MALRLVDIFESLRSQLDVELVGNPDTLIKRLSTLDSAGVHDLTFLSNPKYFAKLANSAAACVIVGKPIRQEAVSRGACLVVDDPYYCFALITQIWKKKHFPIAVPFIHPTAFVDPSASIAKNVSIGAFACIAAGSELGEGVHVGEYCAVGPNSSIGSGTRLSARVTVGERCHIGERGIFHPGAVIGADGFGFALHDGKWIKIEQLGAVRIGNDVEVGANTCIDRGALEDTVIEDGVKLDNLVQVGHNVRIGKHTAMAGCVGIAGSATIGAHCTIGGGAIVLGHLQIASHVHVSAASVVTRSILKPGHYTGFFPIDDNAAWEKNAVTLKQLHALRDRLRQTEKLLSHAQNKV